jgi:RNA polymerase sigma-70 factor (ECF subfamily)
MPVLARTAPNDPPSWCDAELLARVLRRDDVAWNELVRRYRNLIFRCVSRVAHRHARGIPAADLDEIFADVLVALVRDDLRKLRLYNPGRGMKLGSWIGMIAIHCAYDHLRGVGRRPMLDKFDGVVDPEVEHERNPLELLMEKERWAHLEDMLADFSEKDRTFVQLYFGQGLEPEAIASQMAISLKTVYTKKHKIREHLRDALRALQGDSPIADLVGSAA